MTSSWGTSWLDSWSDAWGAVWLDQSDTSAIWTNISSHVWENVAFNWEDWSVAWGDTGYFSGISDTSATWVDA